MSTLFSAVVNGILSMRDRSFDIWVALLGLGGCSTAEPSRIQDSQLTGSWLLQITDTAGCAGSAPTPAPIAFRIVRRRDPYTNPDDAIPGFFVDTTSSWTNGTLSGYVAGTMNLGGDVGLGFTPGAYDFATQGRVPYLWFLATIGADLVLNGVLYDPAPGSIAFPPLLTAQPCAYRARATH